MSRIVLRIVLQVVVAVALTLLLAGLYFWLVLGETPANAFFDQAVLLVLGFIDVGILVWLGLLILGGARKRGIGWGFGGSLVAALIGAVANLVWIVIISIVNGGADIFAIALGVQAAIFFLIGVVLAELLVRRVLLRDPPADTAKEPDAAPGA